MDYVIEVKNLVKTYKKAKENAVDNISFNVKKGEFFCFLGPNGAGKTTTISILTTTLAKTSGTLNIAGYDLDKDPSSVRKSIGVIFQKPSLDQNLTAEENIRFHAVLYGLYPFAPFYSLMPQEYKNKVNELGELLGIKNDLNKPIKSFSGGMKRKLEIIRSLIHNPKILFLDEPTSGLDPEARRTLWQYLKDVRKKEKMTIFLTTHYLDEAEDADRICIISKGKIKELGTPSTIKSKLLDEYLIINSKDPQKLEKELTKKKLKFEFDDNFKIDINGYSAQEVIKKIDTKLDYLKIHSPSLEEAYINLIDLENEI